MSCVSKMIPRPCEAPVRLLSTAVTKRHDAFMTSLSTACANVVRARIVRCSKDIDCHVEVTGAAAAFTKGSKTVGLSPGTRHPSHAKMSSRLSMVNVSEARGWAQGSRAARAVPGKLHRTKYAGRRWHPLPICAVRPAYGSVCLTNSNLKPARDHRVGLFDARGRSSRAHSACHVHLAALLFV
jgi:hypothetical protein